MSQTLSLAISFQIEEAQAQIARLKDSAKGIGASAFPDTSSALKSVSQLNSQFDITKKSLTDTLEANKKLLTSMALSGDTGSKAYKDIVDETKKVSAELANIDKVAKDVDKTISGKSFLSGLKEQSVNATSIAIGVLSAKVVEFGATLIKDGVEKGVQFEKGLKELQAITGVSGSTLELLGESAKAMALEFGTSATDNIESFKAVLSRLGPDIAKSPEALDSMARSINTLSKATGDDAVKSMDALTTALLQFGVNLDNPIEAAKAMEIAMNVMAAGAKVGASEVPQVSEALKVAGVAAKGAKVSFEETNAAIQILAAGGKFGAEAGTALRNVLAKLGEGRFLPKETANEMKQAGVSIEKLTDTTVPLADRLQELTKIQNDTALVSKLFGAENAAAGTILLQNTEQLRQWTAEMTGTKTATEQAAINMSSFSARIDKFKATIETLAISGLTAIVPILNTAFDGIANTFSTIGTVATTLFDKLSSGMSAVQDSFNSALPTIQNVGIVISQFAGFAGAIGAVGGAVLGLQKAWLAVTSAVELYNIVQARGGFQTAAILAYEKAVNLVRVAKSALAVQARITWTAVTGPIGLAVLAIAGFSAAFVALYNYFPPFKKIVDDVIGWAVAKFSDLWEGIKKVGGAIAKFLGLSFEVDTQGAEKATEEAKKFSDYQKDGATSTLEGVKKSGEEASKKLQELREKQRTFLKEFGEKTAEISSKVIDLKLEIKNDTLAEAKKILSENIGSLAGLSFAVDISAKVSEEQIASETKKIQDAAEKQRIEAQKELEKQLKKKVITQSQYDELYASRKKAIEELTDVEIAKKRDEIEKKAQEESLKTRQKSIIELAKAGKIDIEKAAQELRDNAIERQSVIVDILKSAGVAPEAILAVVDNVKVETEKQITELNNSDIARKQKIAEIAAKYSSDALNKIEQFDVETTAQKTALEKQLEDLRASEEERTKILSEFETKRGEEKIKLKEDLAKKELEIKQRQNDTELTLITDVISKGAALFKQNTIAFKALAIAEATINTYRAASSALAAIPFGPWNFVQAGVAIATGLANVAKIVGVQFRKGGYTGDGNPDEVAGIAHKSEFVFTAEQTRVDKTHFERMTRERLPFEQYAKKYILPRHSITIQEKQQDFSNIEKRLAAIERNTRAWQSRQSIELEIEMSDKELIEKIKRRERSLRSRL